MDMLSDSSTGDQIPSGPWWVYSFPVIATVIGGGAAWVIKIFFDRLDKNKEANKAQGDKDTANKKERDASELVEWKSIAAAYKQQLELEDKHRTQVRQEVGEYREALLSLWAVFTIQRNRLLETGQQVEQLPDWIQKRMSAVEDAFNHRSNLQSEQNLSKMSTILQNKPTPDDRNAATDGDKK